jgi:hypothetical protein
MTQVTGLNPGEVVADSSFEKLQNGAKVNVVQQPSSGGSGQQNGAAQQKGSGQQSGQQNAPASQTKGSKKP